MPMSHDELIALAARWNASGDQILDDAPRKIELMDAMNQTACVKLTAVWGIDYMHLAKVDGKCQILHVLWQSVTAPSGS